MGFGSVALQALSTGKTVDLVLNQLVILGEHPVLVVEHMGESNRSFWNDAIAKANVNVAGTTRGKLTEAEIAKGRAANRESLAKHCVKGLRGFYHDVDGHPGTPDPARPATMADLVELLGALPADVIDSVVKYVSNPDNFRERLVTADARDVAGK